MKNILDDEGDWESGLENEKLLYGEILHLDSDPVLNFRKSGGDWFFLKLLPEVLPVIDEINQRLSKELASQYRRSIDDNSVAQLLYRNALNLANKCLLYKLGGKEYKNKIRSYFPNADFRCYGLDADVSESESELGLLLLYWDIALRASDCGMLMCRWIYEIKFLFERLGALDAELAAKIEKIRELEIQHKAEIAEKDAVIKKSRQHKNGYGEVSKKYEILKRILKENCPSRRQFDRWIAGENIPDGFPRSGDLIKFAEWARQYDKPQRRETRKVVYNENQVYHHKRDEDDVE